MVMCGMRVLHLTDSSYCPGSDSKLLLPATVNDSLYVKDSVLSCLFHLGLFLDFTLSITYIGANPPVLCFSHS